uniref:Uncharacterized protein n=1 Tax=Anguilla anguilla TaxID=7936 RepID=A0A0E9QPN2_ANGAN
MLSLLRIWENSRAIFSCYIRAGRTGFDRSRGKTCTAGAQPLARALSLRSGRIRLCCGFFGR